MGQELIFPLTNSHLERQIVPSKDSFSLLYEGSGPYPIG